MLKDPYIERWCRLTKESFQVFSGSQAFARLDCKGMIEIPIISISHVQRVKYDINVKNIKLKSTADNQFEIVGRFDNADLRGCNLLVQ